MRSVPYDTLCDFASIAMVALSPYILVVHPLLPARNVKEFIALGRSRQDQINYASGGSGRLAHPASELSNQMAGVKLREFPFKGAGPALMATLWRSKHKKAFTAKDAKDAKGSQSNTKQEQRVDCNWLRVELRNTFSPVSEGFLRVLRPSRFNAVDLRFAPPVPRAPRCRR
jgi:hypothetical protein